MLLFIWIWNFCYSVTPRICNFHKAGILQLTYFCGSAPICKFGGNFDVLQRAKYNVEAYYSLVGLTNDLKRSFELLEVFLPAFFSGMLILTWFNLSSNLHENGHEKSVPTYLDITLISWTIAEVGINTDRSNENGTLTNKYYWNEGNLNKDKIY